MKITQTLFVSYVKFAGGVLLSTLLLFACSKSDSPPDIKEPQYRTDVYLVGAYEDQAAYWKNGEKTLLEVSPSTKSSNARAIYVYEDDVHIVGSTRNETCYWKNGKITPLPQAENTPTRFRSVFVSNGDVYIAGESSINRKRVATYWKNGTPVVLTNPLEGDSYISDIFVSGNDVYAAGGAYDYNLNTSSAMYWKNGTPVILSDPTQWVESAGIFVDGKDVYVAGTDYSDKYITAMYWKNGQPKQATKDTDAQAGSIIHSEGNTYISLFDYSDGNTYWKNGEITKIEDNYSEGSEIFVSDGDLYVSGAVIRDDRFRAAYWKNGKAVMLTDGTESHSEAHAIFITKTLE